MTLAQPAAAAETAETVDQLVKIDSAQGLSDATRHDVKVVGGERPLLELADSENHKARREGIWESAPRAAEFPFTDMIPSWNVVAPADTGVRFFVRVRDAKNHVWSPWLYVGFWGSPAPVDSAARHMKFAGGEVDIDTVKLSQPADQWQMRAALESTTVATPSVRRVSVVYSGRVDDSRILQEFHAAVSGARAGTIDLPVPYRAQHDTPEDMRHQVCSPTSVSMVLEYWGTNFPTEENCRAIWDSEYQLYGNWNRAVARAGALGLDAWVTRFRDWQQVRATLAAGQPIVASIRFKEGEFPSNIQNSTEGHLIVIRGITAEGDAICNDPANRQRGNHVIYKADELGRAWFGRGGVAYIIHGGSAKR